MPEGHLPEARMPKLVRKLLIALAALLGVIAVALAGLYWAARQVPDFYRQSLAAGTSEQPVDSDRLEEQALALHNQIQRAGRFEVRFSEAEINAWLAAELPRKFPRLLPTGVSDPRVAIDRDLLRVAARSQETHIDTVVSLAADVYLTDQPNEIAIRVGQLRAGALPIALGPLQREIIDNAARAGLPLRWTEAQSAPVALVRLPADIVASDEDGHTPQRLVLEQLRLEPGQLVVAGRVEQLEEPRAEAASVTADQPAESPTRQR
jgi:hypothetical protein